MLRVFPFRVQVAIATEESRNEVVAGVAAMDATLLVLPICPDEESRNEHRQVQDYNNCDAQNDE